MSPSTNRLGVLDMMFLYGETPSTMMHVGALLPFSAPADAPADHLRRVVEDTRARDVAPPWNRKLSHPRLLYSPTQSWVVDHNVDFDYHVRRSALASPGDERELGTLVSRLHSNPVDLTRPPWELHLIEGLADGRFAWYVKIHHSLLDGFTGMKVLGRSLSTDPGERHQPLFFTVPEPRTGRSHAPASGDENRRHGLAGALVGSVTGLGRSAVSLTRALVNTEIRRDGDFGHLASSAQAPHCILNNRIGRNRRFATQQYALARLKALGATHGATLNDVALAVIGGGLRTFLAELGELPDQPLIAFLPVNVRAKDDAGGGNAVGAILVGLGTDIADPTRRLAAITASTRMSKSQLQTMSRNAIMAYSAALLAPASVQVASALTGVRPPWPFTYNLSVSNVPGPPDALYFNGSRLEASYPVSIAGHGMALNITLHSYADTLNVGFVGCRETLPHLQRLAVYTGAALEELESMTAR